MDYGSAGEGYGDGTLTGGDFHAPVSLVGDLSVYYDYDPAGNATRREEVAASGEAITWDFSYDGSNQQREVLLDGGSGGRELYLYDGSGARYMAVTYESASDIAPSRVSGGQFLKTTGPKNQGRSGSRTVRRRDTKRDNRHR